MTTTIPLIRGFALLPALRWFARRQLAPEEALRAADLPLDIADHPFRPIPLVNVANLLKMAARQFGADLPSRMVLEADDLELAMLGKVALGARTPREVMARLIAALPFYCSHEQISMQRNGRTTVLREFFAHRFEPETLHLLLQYAATMMDRICAMTGAVQPRFVSVELPPHPTFGMGHIPACLANEVKASQSRGLTVVVEDRIFDGRYLGYARDRLSAPPVSMDESLRGDGTLASSVRLALILMFAHDQAPTFKRAVAAAGISERTFQRQLDAEGTSFSQLLAEVRLDEAIRRLKEKDASIATIAAELGYADQAALTRAFRRWTGKPPSRFRPDQPAST